jgi:hypothetical protein
VRIEQTKAGHIISGDRHLLALTKYQNIKILSPAEFIRKLVLFFVELAKHPHRKIDSHLILDSSNYNFRKGKKLRACIRNPQYPSQKKDHEILN